MRNQERSREAARRRLNVVESELYPAYVVWELTLKCDHACHHCGSRAVKARPEELTTADALRVVEQLAAMKTREVVLIGGEAMQTVLKFPYTNMIYHGLAPTYE